MSARTGILRLSGVTRRFEGRGGVEDVSLALPPRGVTALLGASGSGKSTLLRLIAGLEPLDAGEIAIDGEPLSRPGRIVPPEARRIGLVFQDYALFPHMSAEENVAFGLFAAPAAERRAHARAWLARVGLADRADAFPHQLSGGEQQRVALARALAPRPRAILLDEPFSGLDPLMRGALRDVALEAIRAAGATAIFVTHDADEALYVADQLAILKDGRLLQAGDPREIYARPASPAAAAALGPINTAPGRVQNGMALCAMGALPAPGFADGAAVEIVVRAEALALGPGGGARVLERRAQGAFDLVRIEAGGLVWRALVPVEACPEPGDQVTPSLVRGHVFPATA